MVYRIYTRRRSDRPSADAFYVSPPTDNGDEAVDAALKLLDRLGDEVDLYMHCDVRDRIYDVREMLELTKE